MAASCYLCLRGLHATIPGRTTGDAEGACRNCGALACGGHGYRDPSIPIYSCMLCRIGSIALAAAGGSGGDLADLPPSVRPPGDSPLTAAARRIRDVADFTGADDAEAWEGMLGAQAREWRDALRDVPATDAVAAWPRRLPAERRALLGWAYAMADHFGIPDHELLPLVGVLRARRAAS